MFIHVANDVKFPKLERKNEDGKRVYYDEEGNRYRSVTSVVGTIDEKGLQEWKDRVGEDVANHVSIKAATLGTKLHKLVENYLYNKRNTE